MGAVAHAPRPSLGAVLLPTFKQMFDGVWPFLKKFSFNIFSGKAPNSGCGGSCPTAFRCRIFSAKRLTVGAVAHAPRPSLGAVLLPTFKQMFDGVWPFLKRFSFNIFSGKAPNSGCGGSCPTTFTWCSSSAHVQTDCLFAVVLTAFSLSSNSEVQRTNSENCNMMSNLA